jgi:predicted Zn-dependent protease
MLLSPEDVKAFASKIIGRSRADACTVSVSGGSSRHFRFAKNEATTNGALSDITISIESSFGLRSGSVTVNSLDDAALEKAQAHSEKIAQLSPVTRNSCHRFRLKLTRRGAHASTLRPRA